MRRLSKIFSVVGLNKNFFDVKKEGELYIMVSMMGFNKIFGGMRLNI